MAWVYRYTDLADGIIKYVGVVWGETRTLEQRIKEHERNDEWCYTRKWKIEYITKGIDTRNEAESYESHYIELYGTGKYFNIRQTNYGTNKFLPNKEEEWKECKISYQIAFDGKIKQSNIANKIAKVKRHNTQFTDISKINSIDKIRSMYPIIKDMIFKEYTFEEICNGLSNGIFKLLPDSVSQTKIFFVSNGPRIQSNTNRTDIECIDIKMNSKHCFSFAKEIKDCISSSRYKSHDRYNITYGPEEYIRESYSLYYGYKTPRYCHDIEIGDKQYSNFQNKEIVTVEMENEIKQYLNNFVFYISRRAEWETDPDFFANKCVNTLIKRLAKCKTIV